MATRSPTGPSLFGVLWRLLALAFLFAIIVFTFTDAWPWMHEVIVQQSWRPVCLATDGMLHFCPVWGR